MARQTRLFAICVALLVCSVSVLAATDIIVANFEERRSGRDYAYTTGVLYYKYDSSDRTKSRLRFEHTIKNQVYSNLYHYTDGAMYSMCSKSCTGILITEGADPWYYDSNFYTQGAQEGSYYWYNRNSYGVTDKVRAQIKRILMDNKGIGANMIQKIEFYDGRVLTLTNVQHATSGYDAKFAVDSSLNCPKATCPIYADIVFVLDNSGSVDNGEWTKTANFVNAVMDTFTFGDDAVEAAIIQFNGQSAKSYCSTRVVDGCSQCYTDWGWYSAAFPGYSTATIIAGLDRGSGLTVSSDRANLKQVMSGNRPSRNGNTCQGYGLQLAMSVLDRSPRSRYGKKPKPIVIAVTDGQDMCHNTTADAATKLKNQYDAFVVEVGVGMSSGCNNYDKKFLQRIASKVGSGDTAAYYDVTNYNAIKDVTEKLFKPLCDGFNSECGPDCLGFCGCGQCICPECDDLHSTCEKTTCSADGTSSTGCKKVNITCDLPVDACQWYNCHGDQTEESKRCEHVDNDCKKLRDANPGKCRENWACSTSVSGGCYLIMNDAYCQTTHGNECEQYECTPAGATPDFKDTGCRLKSNKTQEKQDELNKAGKTCFKATCNPSTGVTGEESNCPTSKYPKCYTNTCVLQNGKYTCKDIDKDRPKDNLCNKFKCGSNPSDGWVVSQVLDDKATCTTKLNKTQDIRCKNIFCDDNTGCSTAPIAGCSTKCDADQALKCISEGLKDSPSAAQCILRLCDAHEESPGMWKPFCDVEHQQVFNCLTNGTIAETVEKLNKNQTTDCYTPACGEDGYCGYTSSKAPDNMPKTRCMMPQCNKQSDGSWKWEYVETLEGRNCHTDDCSRRTCDATNGCQEQELICIKKSTECTKYTCEVNVDAEGLEHRSCVSESLLRETSCTYEVCDEKTKTKVVETNLEKCSYNLTDKCIKANCAYDQDTKTSYCYYTPIDPPDNDPCKVHKCDPATGNWTTTPKCDDGLYCTENVCTIFGECKYPQIQCSEEIAMEGYPCFEARCREDAANKTHKCVRKLIHNAYIDVCGNCIQDSASEGTTTSSVIHSGVEEESVDYVTCTGAPAKPLLTEGLAAASIALIILAAVLIGAGIAASGVLGTKTLIERARGANNQSAHTNPLFQDNEAEMSNPAFIEEKEMQ